MILKFKLEENAKKPEKAHKADAGYDLFALSGGSVAPGKSIDCDTGVHIDIPEGFFGDIRSKSGLFFHHGIFTDGTIDAGYTGSIHVNILNLGQSDFQYEAGEKIAQIVFSPIAEAELFETDTLSRTERGSNGFGSTGRK